MTNDYYGYYYRVDSIVRRINDYMIKHGPMTVKVEFVDSYMFLYVVLNNQRLFLIKIRLLGDMDDCRFEFDLLYNGAGPLLEVVRGSELKALRNADMFFNDDIILKFLNVGDEIFQYVQSLDLDFIIYDPPG